VRLLVLGQAFYDPTGVAHPGLRLVVDLHDGLPTGDGHHLGQGQRTPANENAAGGWVDDFG
jgi:hypothetical protein